MSDSIRNLISSIIDDNSVESEKHFNDVMNDKLVDRIDDYRKAIANSFFNPEPVAEENYTHDTGEGEHGDGQFPSGQMDQWAASEESEDPPAEDPPAEETPE